MKLEFFYNSSPEVKPWKCDVQKVIKLLKTLESRENKCKIIDTSKISEEERSEAYLKAIVPSVWKRYKIRRVFGTRNSSGVFFGMQEPALLIYEEGVNPIDVFPHKEKGRIITIEEFLSNLLKTKDR